MIFPLDMMHDSVWMDRPKYDEAEEQYQLFLNKNLTVQITSCHAKTDGPTDETPPAPVRNTKPSPLIDEIAKARENIKTSLSGMTVTAPPDTGHVAKLGEENKAMKKLIEDLSKQVAALELRVGKLEEPTPAKSTPAPAPAPAKKEADNDDDEDDDFDIFDEDDDGSDEEETEADRKKKEELVKKYHEKKSKKPALIPKSSIILDIKPWEDETDMVEMERLVRTVVMDGLLWGQAKLVPVGYGIKKLQISCVVEDDKVGTEILDEEITKFEDYVQSVDVAAFNKI